MNTCWPDDQMKMDALVGRTYSGRCYFYPGRDCPGWTGGQFCGRIGGRIPPDGEASDAEEEP